MQKIYVVNLESDNCKKVISEINSILSKNGKVVSVTAVPKATASDYYCKGDVIIVIEMW